jgi:hypothetical protein
MERNKGMVEEGIRGGREREGCFCMFCDTFEGDNATNNIAMAKQTNQGATKKVVARLAWLNVLNGNENGRDPMIRQILKQRLVREDLIGECLGAAASRCSFNEVLKRCPRSVGVSGRCRL